MINKIIFFDGDDELLKDICYNENLEKHSCWSYIETGLGYTDSIRWLNTYLKQSKEEDFSLITNSLIIWDNKTLRDLVNQDMSKYYIYRDNRETPIQELTDKEIKPAHNLEKMYIAGMFDKEN